MLITLLGFSEKNAPFTCLGENKQNVNPFCRAACGEVKEKIHFTLGLCAALWRSSVQNPPYPGKKETTESIP